MSRLDTTFRIDAEHYVGPAARLRDKLRGTGVPFGDIFHPVVHPGEFTRTYQEAGGGRLFLRAQNIRPGRIDASDPVYVGEATYASVSGAIASEDELLLVRTGANLGDLARVTPEFSGVMVSSHTLRLIPRDRGLACALEAFFISMPGRALLLNLRSGGTHGQINASALGQLMLPDLSPVSSECRDLLHRASALRQRQQFLYSEAESLLLRELHLDSLDLSRELTYEANFSNIQAAGRLDAEYWRSDYVTIVSHLSSRLHSTLGCLSDFSNGATPLGANYLDAGIPFLRIENVQKNRLDLNDVVYISEAIHNTLLARSQLCPGDVLITITGRIGTAAAIPDELPVANMNQHSVRLRLRDPAKTNPYYLAAFLNSPLGRLQTERESYGTTRDALPYYCLRRVLIPDAPLPLQHEVEAAVRSADRLRQEAKSLLDEAKRRVEEVIGQ